MTMTANCPVTMFREGGVNLDGESSEDLMSFWSWCGASGSPSVRAARTLFPDRPPKYVSVTGTLRAYAASKATAMTCRTRGNIQTAQVYETICERIYSELPQWAKW